MKSVSNAIAGVHSTVLLEVQAGKVCKRPNTLRGLKGGHKDLHK